MYYIDTNKNTIEHLTPSDISKQRKVFHLINHFISLSLDFHQTKENENEAGKISIDNGGLNSMSKYILNNFIQIVSKCKGISVPKNIYKFRLIILDAINSKDFFLFNNTLFFNKITNENDLYYFKRI